MTEAGTVHDLAPAQVFWVHAESQQQAGQCVGRLDWLLPWRVPVQPQEDLPAEWEKFIEVNAAYYKK